MHAAQESLISAPECVELLTDSLCTRLMEERFEEVVSGERILLGEKTLREWILERF